MNEMISCEIAWFGTLSELEKSKKELFDLYKLC